MATTEKTARYKQPPNDPFKRAKAPAVPATAPTPAPIQKPTRKEGE